MASQRKSAPRSTSGCRTCRGRHVKCPEQRPQCAACARLDLLCVYDKPSKKNPVQSSSDAMASLPIAQYQIPFKAPGTPADRKALHYFFVHASVELSAYLSLGFWDGLLLQLCQTDTTVQQAVIALSRAHLELSNGSSPRSPRPPPQQASPLSQPSRRQLQSINNDFFEWVPETLEAYQRAVRRLIYSMRKQPGPSHSVVLTCCILLYTFSGLAGDSSHAEVHLSHGVQILREMIDDKQTNSSPAAEKGSLHSTKEGLDALKPVMARLDLELAQYSQGDMWLVLQDDAYDVEERQDFANVQDAALDLYRLFRMLKRLMEQVKVFVEHSVLTAPQVVVASHAQLTRAFVDWRRRFSAYESKHGSIDATAQQTHRIKSKSQLLEALSVQVLKTDYLLIKQSLDSLVLDFPFTRRDRPLQPVGTESANLLSAARRALELQVAYKKACDLPMSHQVSAHWSISDTLAILSVEPETRERALALSREFSPVVAGLKTRSPTGRDDV